MLCGRSVGMIFAGCGCVSHRYPMSMQLIPHLWCDVWRLVWIGIHVSVGVAMPCHSRRSWVSSRLFSCGWVSMWYHMVCGVVISGFVVVCLMVTDQ